MSIGTTLTDAVQRGIAQLQEMFEVSVDPLDSGSAIVTVHALDIGSRWTVSAIELSFEIAFNYPFAPIYPFYTPAPLVSIDGAQPAALQRVEWRGSTHTQISLRATRWSPQVDTAVGTVVQVQRWLRGA